MGRIVEVVYDGEVLRPVEPVNELRASAHYEIEIITEKPLSSGVDDPWDILDRLEGTVDAPADWSVEHDHYLYGTPKNHPGTSR